MQHAEVQRDLKRFLILNRVIDIYILMIDKDLNRGDRDTTIVNRIPIASKCIGIRDRDRDYTIEGRLKLQRGEGERCGPRSGQVWQDLIHQPECKFHSIKRILVFI